MRYSFSILCILFLCSSINAQDVLTKKVGDDGTIFYVGNGVIKFENGEITFPLDVKLNNVEYKGGFLINDTYESHFIMSRNGKIIVPNGKYDIYFRNYRDEIGNIYFHVAKKTKKGYYEGFVDEGGNEIVKPQYKYAGFTHDGFKVGKNFKKAKLINVKVGKREWNPFKDRKGTAGRRYKFKDISGTEFYLTEIEGLKGLTDAKGYEILPNKYKSLEYDYEAQCLLGMTPNSCFVCYNVDGDRILEKLNAPISLRKSYAIVGDKVKEYFVTGNYGNEGVCDINGNQILPNKYKGIVYSNELGFYENYWDKKKKRLVSASTNVFLYDTLKSRVVYDNVEYTMITYKGKSGLMNMAGEMVIPVKYGTIKQSNDHLFLAYQDKVYNSSCAVYTLEGLKLIDENRGYTDISLESAYGYSWYRGRTGYGLKDLRYGACDLRGNEILPCKEKELIYNYKNRLYPFKYKKKRHYLSADLDEFVTTKQKADDISESLNQQALTCIKTRNYEKARDLLKQSIYYNAFEMNDAYYLLGHYYCFGVFGEDGLNKHGKVNRKGLKPINANKGLDYLNMSLSSSTADIFADREAWTYNPDKAIRLYAIYSGIVGDINEESKKIRNIFLQDNNFEFDVEYFYNQTFQEYVKNKDYIKDVADFIFWFPSKMDTIISIVDKIPLTHKSSVLNVVDMSNKDLLYMGIKYFNSRQFGQAMYYFRRGAMHGDENCYSLSVMCLDSIARHYSDNATPYIVAKAFAELFPFDNHNGNFEQKRQEFQTYYVDVYTTLREERKRKMHEERYAEYQRIEAKRERRRAILGAVLQGFAQGVQAYYNVKANTSNNSSFSQGMGTAINMQMPEAFNPQRIAAMSTPVYTYDANGNMMMSFPGFAQALGEMNSEIQRITKQVSTNLMATGDPYYIAKAQSLQAVANTSQWTTPIDQQFWSTPMYPEVWDTVYSSDDSNIDTTEDSDSHLSNQRKISSSDYDYEPDENISNLTSKKGKLTSNKRVINDCKHITSRNSNARREGDESDSKLQYHIGTVSSTDYKIVKYNVTLYLRDGDKAKPYMHNKDLYRKGATYYIKINNKYYLVGYSNWSRFNRAIIYGTTSAYFDM